MPRNNNGFSLIELLVALVLMAILAVMVNAILANSIDSVSLVRDSENQREKIQALDRLLGLALRESQEINLTNAEKAEATNSGDYEAGEGTLRFSMGPDRVGFCLGRPFTGRPDGKTYWIEILVVPGEDAEEGAATTRLILRETAYLKGAQEPLGFDDEEAQKLEVREAVLLDKLRFAVFRFWYLSDEATTSSDTESFPEYEEDEDMDEEGQTFSDGFPEFVTLQIIFANGKDITLYFRPNYSQQVAF